MHTSDKQHMREHACTCVAPKSYECTRRHPIPLSLKPFFRPFWALVNETTPNNIDSAMMTPLIQSIGNMGGLFGPLIVGLVRERSTTYKPALFVLAAFATTAVLPIFFVPILPKVPGAKKRFAAH